MSFLNFLNEQSGDNNITVLLSSAFCLGIALNTLSNLLMGHREVKWAGR